MWSSKFLGKSTLVLTAMIAVAAYGLGTAWWHGGLTGSAFWSVLAVLIAGTALILWWLWPVAQFLAIITANSDRLASESPVEPLAIPREPELRRLATAFNAMSRSVQSRLNELQLEQQQLARNNDRLRTLLAAMVEGVLAVDREERLIFVNHSAVRLLDLNSSALVGRPFWEAIRHPQLTSVVQQALRGDVASQQELELEIARTHRVLGVTVSQLPGAPSTGVLLVLHDVTELRRLEALRRDFVQNVSHELKTPLASIAAYADTLLEGGLDDLDCRERFVQQIAEQADRLHALILDLLALARMENGADATFEVAPMEITPILQASVEAHRQVAASKQIKLTASAPREPVWGLVDAEGLRTIIDNLLDNALNYTPTGGQVTAAGGLTAATWCCLSQIRVWESPRYTRRRSSSGFTASIKPARGNWGEPVWGYRS